ncbi:hypothetical protein AVEN_160027-1 [Araneus ventricosus]|uniref:Uncharacterized protein n=1 Tax=Araneus ventricosus TaxID=182803 RepID=A0A4Y2K1Y0_ARAVE|nr:hypothetical protein AVEN_160027-1 [Araneus ventricosus]
MARQSKWSGGYQEQLDIQPSIPILIGPHRCGVVVNSQQPSPTSTFRALPWSFTFGHLRHMPILLYPYSFTKAQYTHAICIAQVIGDTSFRSSS